MNEITRELRKLQIRQAELLEALRAIHGRRESIIKADPSKNNKKGVVDMLHTDDQPKEKNQATIKQKKGETKPAASDSPKILQIRDIVKYSRRPGSTQPQN